jgi:hypothetical protein
LSSPVLASKIDVVTPPTKNQNHFGTNNYN